MINFVDHITEIT